MTERKIGLKPSSKVEITILVDNYVDVLLPDQPGIVRQSSAKDGKILSKTLLAEHGLSLLIDTWAGETRHRILLDTGYNPGTFLHNMRMLDLDPKEIEAIVISHGHMDHTGSVTEALEAIGKPVPVIFHPDIFRTRFLARPNTGLAQFPKITGREQMVDRGAQLTEDRGPTLIAGGTALVTGEIPRVTGFEKGMPGAQIEIDGKLGIDKIADDQAIVINLADHGLVVISGCAHSGIINSILYAQKVTGEKKVFGALGGFHLIGPDMMSLIDSTVEEMKRIDPKFIMPMHCTGRVAMQRLHTEFANRFVLSSVGTKIILPTLAC